MKICKLTWKFCHTTAGDELRESSHILQIQGQKAICVAVSRVCLLEVVDRGSSKETVKSE